MVEEKREPVARRQRLQDHRVPDDLGEAGSRQDGEPQRHGRTEQAPEGMGSEPLAREQHGKQGERDRQHERLQPRLS
jgi:hypothetical protein